MTPLRPELLELTPQALMALSNAGFVKRGQKELDNGNIPELEQDDDGTLTAVFSDGTCTRLAKDQALKESSCTCGASGMCRHRVMLILSYQRANAGNALAEAEPESAERWHPGQWQKELATLPESILKRAQQLADKGITVELFCRPNEAPSAKLPMSDVRFYSRSSIRFARCDCVDGSLCEHVALAVQAFTDAEAQQPGFTHLVWQTRSRKIAARGGPFDTPEGETCRLRLRQLSQLLWHNGVSQPPIGFEAAFTRARRAAQAANWRWVVSALAELREGVTAFEQRASHYHPEQLLAQLAGLNARLESAAHMAQLADTGQTPPLPWRTVVGLGIAGEAQLDHLRLISLGMRCWQDNHRYGLCIWFSDPDTGSVMHLSRSWPLAERAQSPLWQRRLFSFQASTLAGGQIITQSASRNAGGELLLGARHRLSSNVPLSEDAWLLLSAPLRQPGAAALREHLRQRDPAWVRPLDQVDNLFILPVDSCVAVGWDAARQTLDALVLSGEGQDNLLQLSLPVCASAPYAVERMAALLQQQDDPVVMVSGLVTLSGGMLCLEPLVMMTRSRAWALNAEPLSVGPLPAGNILPPPSLAQSLLQRARTLLIQILHNGLRYQQKSLFREAQTLSVDLANAGFSHLARLLRQLGESETATSEDTLSTIAQLCIQLEMMID
ncbi:SWIM zinc finger family protein [Klebsiella sp. BDA134-6]|uniref:SWIM zinc finger family protein n=1 Tax=Klebsiella TaxID=570 RepID=UPI00189CA732|nr:MULTISPECIES: SWIM zinc finger family protein [Klebsiella]QPF26119.1 SWIM zinc finger family protein [Klebsiella sp. BDA134-6]